MKSVNDNEEKWINKELNDIKTNKPKKESKKEHEKKLLKQMSLKRTLGLILIIIVSIFMLVLFCNRTFFRSNYKTSKINIDIPLLMFFVKDDGNELVFKTYRKTKYVRNYFDNMLNNYTIYKGTDGTIFYYDEINGTAFYSIDVEKGFALKTVTIKYAVGDANCLSLCGLTGKEAEEACRIKK